MVDEQNGAAGTDSSGSLKNAFDKSLKTLSNIASPLLIIGILRDFNDAVIFITENLLISLALAGVLLFLFLFYLISSRKSKKDSPVPAPAQTAHVKRNLRTTSAPPPESIPKKYSKFRTIWIIVTIGALVLLGTLFSLFAFTGVHYIMIASYQEPAASREEQKINDYMAQNNINGIQIVVNKSKGENTYDALMVNGPHFSKKSALKTYQLSEKYIKGFMDKNPQLISYYLFKKTQFINLTNISEP